MLIQYKMIHVLKVQRCHSSHTQKQLDDFLGVVKPYIQIVQTRTFFYWTSYYFYTDLNTYQLESLFIKARTDSGLNKDVNVHKADKSWKFSMKESSEE